MTADDTPAVPDTEAVREALAWFRTVGVHDEPQTTWERHAATVVRAALARDERGVNARVQELIDGLEPLAAKYPGHVRGLLGPELCDRLRAALARDVPAPACHTCDHPRSAHPEVDRLRSEVAALRDAGNTLADAAEILAEGIAAGVNDVPGLLVALETTAAAWRSAAGDDELRRGSLVDADGACVQCGHLATSHRPETGECTKCRGQFACYAPGIRAGGGVTAGQDERDRELAILHRSLSTFERIVDNAFNAIPDDVVAEDDSLASYIRAALAAAAAPAVDTAAPADETVPRRSYDAVVAIATARGNERDELQRLIDQHRAGPDPLRDAGDGRLSVARHHVLHAHALDWGGPPECCGRAARAVLAGLDRYRDAGDGLAEALVQHQATDPSPWAAQKLDEWRVARGFGQAPAQPDQQDGDAS